MTTQNHISVPIKLEHLASILDCMREQNASLDVSKALDEAITDWLAKHSDKSTQAIPRIDRGYHWKNVFMPNGTSIRMKYKGEFHYAAVQGDKVVYEGQETSPSEFVRLVSETNRNAWNDIWVKRPNDAEWVFADNLRKAKS